MDSRLFFSSEPPALSQIVLGQTLPFVSTFRRTHLVVGEAEVKADEGEVARVQDDSLRSLA